MAAPVVNTCVPWRGLLASLAVVVAGCSDGYPTEDEPLVSPLALTQDQRVVAMNTLGRQAHPRHRWSFALSDGCALQIEVAGAEPRSFALSLARRDVALLHDKAGDVYQVRLAPSQGTGAVVTILESRRYVDAARMRTLVRTLQAGCLQEDQP